MSINLASRLSAVATDPTTGLSHIVWADSNSIWHSVYNPNSETWEDAEAIASTGTEPVTSLNLVANATLIDGKDPGLAVVWQQGDANESDFFYTAAQYDSNANLQWLNSAQSLTSDQVGDLEPTVTVNNIGKIVVIGLKVNHDNAANLSIREDTDLYTQSFEIPSSQFSPTTEYPPPLAAYSPQLTDNGVINQGVIPTSPGSGGGSSAFKSSGSWGAQISFTSKLIKDWGLMDMVPTGGALRKILTPFLDPLELSGTLSGGSSPGWLGNNSSSIYLDSDSTLKWKKTSASPSVANKVVDDILAVLPSPPPPKPVFGFDLDSEYVFDASSPFDLQSIQDTLSLTVKIKYPFANGNKELAKIFSASLNLSAGIKFKFNFTPTSPGGNYYPQTFSPTLDVLGGSLFGESTILGIGLSSAYGSEKIGALASAIAINTAETLYAAINGATQGFDVDGKIVFPVISADLDANLNLKGLSFDIDAKVSMGVNWGIIGNDNVTFSLSFPLTATATLGPISSQIQYSPGWSWPLPIFNSSNSQKISGNIATVSKTLDGENLIFLPSSQSVNASLVGSLITVDFGTSLDELPSPSDFTITVTDIVGNSTNIPVFNVVAGSSANQAVLQLDRVIPISDNLDYTQSDNPATSGNSISLLFNNTEGIVDANGNLIENINALSVTNNTPNSLAYIYNPISGNGQNYISTVLFLAFNTSLNTQEHPDIARFTVSANSTQLNVIGTQVTSNGVFLTFAPSVTNQLLQNVSISYDNSKSLGSSPLEDIDGNLIDSFTIVNGISIQVSQSSVFVSNGNPFLNLSNTLTDYIVTVTNPDGTTVNNVHIQNISLTGNNLFLTLTQNLSPEQTVSISYKGQNISKSSVIGITPPAVTTQSLMSSVVADLGQDSTPFIIPTDAANSAPLLAWVADVPPLEPIAGFVNNNTVTLNFIDELGNLNDVPNASQFTVKDINNINYAVTNVSVSGNSLILTLGTMVNQDTSLNITYNLLSPTAKNTNLFLQNSYTNTTLWIADFADFALTNTTNIVYPPVILSAGSTIETSISNQIILIFNQNLIDHGVANSDFIVESNGQAFAINANISVNANSVILTVEPPTGTDLIGQGDIVTVSYVGNSLSGVNGNVVNFNNQPVVTAPSTPTTIIKYALLNLSEANLASKISSIPGAGGFNFDPVGAYDPVRNITLLLWSNADSSDIKTDLVPGEFLSEAQTSSINESISQSNIYYSIYTPSTGSWSIASPVSQQHGSEGKIAIGQGPNNQLMAAWINNNNGVSTIYWSGLTYNNGVAIWSDPEILFTEADPDPLTELSIISIDGSPTVLWTETQATSYSQLTQNESPLLYYRLAETSGTTLVNQGDYGAGGNGTYSGSVTFNQVGALENTVTNQGDASPAVLFNSSNSATSLTIPVPGNSFSLEFWFKVPTLPSDTLSLVSATGLMNIALDQSDLILDINGWTLKTEDFIPVANEWYYVVGTYDADSNTATLYVNGQSVGNLENVNFVIPDSTSLTLAGKSNTEAVYLDEVAFYREALTNSNTNDFSDIDSLAPSQIHQGLFSNVTINNKYGSQYIAPLPPGPNTYYVSYKGGTWGEDSLIVPNYTSVATELSDANQPDWDVTSFTSANSSGYVNPNGNSDIFVYLPLANQKTGSQIKSIVVIGTNDQGQQVQWSVGDSNGYQLAVVQGDKLLNPLNPSGNFSYTILSPSVDLDLFFDPGVNSFSKNPNFLVTINYNTGNPLVQRLTQANINSEPTNINANEVLGTATVMEANDSSLALIDSGFIINTNNHSIGYSIVSTDFNNDEYSDVAVGNRGYTDTSGNVLDQGTIQIIFGSKSGLSISETNPLSTSDLNGNPKGVLINGLSDEGQANGDFPISMATGDVNGDGFQDLVIGDPNANKVYVIYGSSNFGTKINNVIDVNNLNVDDGYTISAPDSTNIGFGFSVAVGNFNSSSQSSGQYPSGTHYDIVIGAPGANNGNGAVYVAFDGNSTPLPIYNSTNTGELAGHSVAVSSRGAFREKTRPTTFTNNRASDDLIIGAIGYQGTVTNQWNGLDGLPANANNNPNGQDFPATSTSELGAVYVYQSSGIDQTFKLWASYTGPNLPSGNGTANDINIGSALSSFDLDGNAINDLIISAPGGADNDGLIYILSGGVAQNAAFQNLGNAANLVIQGGVSYGNAGAIVDDAGDINDDNYADLLITAPQAANGTGQSYIIFGEGDLLSESGVVLDLSVTATDSKRSFLLNGEQPNQLAGSGASGIGDVNSDGIDDIMISSPNAAQLYAIYGHSWLADDGSLKLANINSDNGFVIDGNQYTSDAVKTEIYKINYQTADLNPTLISYQGILYLAYKGDGNNQIFLTTSLNNGLTWNQAIELPNGMTTNASPSIAFHNGILYLAYQGLDGHLNITHSRDNGLTWSNQYTFNQYSTEGFSLVEYDGNLMVFFASTQSPHNISYIASSNPISVSSWSSSNIINVPQTYASRGVSNISPTVFKNTLYLAYASLSLLPNYNKYYLSSANGNTLANLTWTNSSVYPAINPYTAPNLTNDGSLLYFTYADQNSDIYVLTSPDGLNWSSPQQATNQTTDFTPSGTILNGRLYLGYAGDDQQIYVTASLDSSQSLGGNGNNVVMLGDVNGDGFADVLSGGPNGGVLKFGNSTSNLIDAASSTDDITISLSNVGNVFNTSVIIKFTPLGDINGDGFKDFGAIDSNNNLYLQLGSSDLPAIGSSIILNVPSQTLVNDAYGVGDYNGDGYEDVIFAQANGIWTLHQGSFSGTLQSTSITFSGLTANGLGDINGDGYSDVGLGSPNDNLVSPNFIANGEYNISFGDNKLNPKTFVPPSVPYTDSLNNESWNLYTSYSSDPGYNSSIANQNTFYSPSFAVYNGYLYMAYPSATDSSLWVQRSVDGYNWEGLTNFGGDFKGIFSLAVYNDTLYLSHSANGGKVVITPSTVDSSSKLGINFNSSNSIYTGQTTSYPPTLAVYDNKLYVFFLDYNNQTILYSSSSDGKVWSEKSTVTNSSGVQQSSDWNLGVAVDGDHLYVGFVGYGNSTLNLASYDGISWSSNTISQSSPYGPSLLSVDDTLYMFFMDYEYAKFNNSLSVITSTDGGITWSSSSQPNDIPISSTAPGAVFFQQKILVGYDGDYGQFPSFQDALTVITSNPIYEVNQTQGLGSQLEGIGDFNGDCIEDYGVLAPGFNTLSKRSSFTYENNQGALYIYYGSTLGAISASPDVVLYPQLSSANSTIYNLSNFSAIGDVNGDGYDDVAIASPNSSLTPNDTDDGSIFVVFGGRNWGDSYSPASQYFEPFDLNTLSSNQANSNTNDSNVNGFLINGLPASQAGISLSGGDDVNGDSFGDFIVGAPGNSDSLSFVIFGSDFNNTVSQTGTIGDDIMIGSATGESFIGDQGDDQIYSNGGIDVAYAGPGDDFVTVSDTYFRRLDGGAGSDGLRFEGYNGQDWDLTTLSPGSRLRNFEILVTQDYGANTLTLNSLTVTQLSNNNTVTVLMDKNDTLNLSADFSFKSMVYHYNQKFVQYASIKSAATVLLNLPSLSNVIFDAPDSNTPVLAFPADPLVPADGSSLATNIAKTESFAEIANSGYSDLSSVLDDHLPTRIYVSNPSAAEKNGKLDFTLTRTGDLDKYVWVDYLTKDGDAKAGDRYTPVAGTAVFTPGQTQKIVTVPIPDNGKYVGDRQFSLLVKGKGESFESPQGRVKEFNIKVDPEEEQIRRWNFTPSSDGKKIEFDLTTTESDQGTSSFDFTLDSLSLPLVWNRIIQAYETPDWGGFNGLQGALEFDGNGLPDQYRFTFQDGGSFDCDGVVNGLARLDFNLLSLDPVLVPSARGGVVIGKDENEYISAAGQTGTYRLEGRGGVDVLIGSSERNVLLGGAGSDQLLGRGGTDQLFGDTGDDLLDGGAAMDFLYGGSGADCFVLRSGEGRDRVMDFNAAEGDLFLLNNLTFHMLSFERNNISLGAELLATVIDNTGRPVTNLADKPQLFASI